MKFDAYIATLLEDHDCVIVPDFGGFVANYSSARVNPVNHRFDPPYRKLTFNKLLVHNDGLLASYVARKEEEQYEEAMKGVKNYALYLKQELRERKKVRIEKVGLLLLQSDGSFRFEQFKTPAFFREGFGLDSFFAQPVEPAIPSVAVVEPKAGRETSVVTPPLKKVEQPKPVEVENKPAPEPKVVKLEPETSAKAEPSSPKEKRRKRRLVPVAIAAVLGLPILGYAAWLMLNTTILTDRSELQFSDLNPFGASDSMRYEERLDPYSSSAFTEVESLIVKDEEHYLTLSMDHAPDKTLVVKLSEPASKMPTSADLRYHVIGGCFSVSGNAERMVSRYRALGTNAAIIDNKGGLSRVSIASYATKKEAAKALASYQNDIAGAWLLYK